MITFCLIAVAYVAAIEYEVDLETAEQHYGGGRGGYGGGGYGGGRGGYGGGGYGGGGYGGGRGGYGRGGYGGGYGRGRHG